MSKRPAPFALTRDEALIILRALHLAEGHLQTMAAPHERAAAAMEVLDFRSVRDRLLHELARHDA